MAFSPDGKTVLTVGDNTVRLWRTDTRKALSTPLQHQGHVYAAAFSPDGQSFLVATDYWINLRSWDGRSTQLLAVKSLPGGCDRGLFFEGRDARQVKMVLTDTGNSAFVHLVSFAEPKTSAIQGDGKALLAEWGRRLALTFDPLGHIVSPYPISTPQREGESTPR